MTEPDARKAKRTACGRAPRAHGRTGSRGRPRATAVARRRRARRRPREAIFEIDGVTVSYSGNPAVRDISFDIGDERDHRADRPVGLRQVHAASAASTG